MSNEPTISITANGKTYVVPEGTTIISFLEKMELAPHRVVIEHNRNALTPSEIWKKTILDGDIIEIVKVVAGG
ncbi:MAG: sulfur carrier protein ThiS [Opitutae bacterium]|nr:sulfur carrier protein ThiS [Opitutae bacterium]